MAKVWVQVWTARVPNSVEVEALELEMVQGLESVQAMIPMMVEVEDLRSQLVWEKVKVQQLESALAQRTVSETGQMSESAKESALAKGWGWVLGQ